MSDRELLEAAARAAGINLYVWGTPGSENFANLDAPAGGQLWNPLTSDADALRLAVKLELDVCHTPHDPVMVAVWVQPLGDFIEEVREPDPYAATRRAITRAAAAIGGLSSDPSGKGE